MGTPSVASDKSPIEFELRGLRLSVKVEDIINEPHESHRLPPDAAKEFKSACDNFLLVSESLHKEFAARGWYINPCGF